MMGASACFNKNDVFWRDKNDEFGETIMTKRYDERTGQKLCRELLQFSERKFDS